MTHGKHECIIISSISTVVINELRCSFFLETKIISCRLLPKIHPKSLVSFLYNYLFKQYLKYPFHMNFDLFRTPLKQSVILVKQNRAEECEESCPVIEKDSVPSTA